MTQFLSLQIENQPSDQSATTLLGLTGEALAARFLVKNGYRLVLSNFKAPIGRNLRGAAVTGEIDLIALDDAVLCFIEVKTRSSDQFASPFSAIDLRKQRQITRTARIYRKIFNLHEINFRYDAVAIVLGKEQKPQIELRKNFWTEEKFRKRFWHDEIW